MKTVSNQELTIRVSEHGAELSSIVANATGKEYLWQADPAFWKRHSPVLFPIVGSVWNTEYRNEGTVYPLSQHGFARDMDFTLIAEAENELRFALESTPDTLRAYPFPFLLEIGYRLEGNKVEVLWRVKNTGDKTMHFQIGAHPAFLYPNYEVDQPDRGYFAFDVKKDLVYRALVEKGCVGDVVRPVPLDVDGLLPLNIHVNTQELNKILREEIAALLTENNTVDSDDFTVPEGKKPYVIMVVGVNGVGKTTTIGKLAYQFKKAGKTVYLGAADTFRAAAVEQLDIWGERVGVPVIKQKMGSDPASVAFDTLSSAVANNADVVIIDTAGRLHNKVGLMNELTKIKNVMKKVVADAPHEVLLVLDGSTGQNAFEQAKQFTLATEVTAMAITKLDGTAKGGVVIGISEQFKIPVKYIGLGEGIEDMQVFRKKEFVDSLFGETE